MLEAAPGAVLVEAHDAALRHHRHDGLHPQLGGLLHHEVHALAAGYALGQDQAQRRLALDGQVLLHLGLDTIPHRLAEHGAVFAAAAVEQQQLGAGA